MVQLDSTAGMVVPAGELSALLSALLRPGASLADLCRDKQLRAAAEEAVKGLQVCRQAPRATHSLQVLLCPRQRPHAWQAFGRFLR